MTKFIVCCVILRKVFDNSSACTVCTESHAIKIHARLKIIEFILQEMSNCVRHEKRSNVHDI